MAIGLDLGTSNLVVARLKGKQVETKRLRNAFVAIDDEQRNRLSLGSLNAAHIGAHSYIVGDEAISIARILNREVRRPMASGILNPDEKEGRTVLSALVKALVGEGEGEKCCFSVPATAVDNTKTNTVFHQGFFSALIEKLGYAPEAVNEALAIIYSECADDDHCGIAISHGAGQVNVCASYKLVGSLEFSVARSGDWIDQRTADAIGASVAKVLRVKEDPAFDLMNPDALDADIGPALYYHYVSMIQYELKHLVQQWSKMSSQLDFPDPIPIILSGGTASIKGFDVIWNQEFEKFQKKTMIPFKVKEIRMANDPFGAVARGLLTYGLAK